MPWCRSRSRRRPSSTPSPPTSSGAWGRRCRRSRPARPSDRAVPLPGAETLKGRDSFQPRRTQGRDAQSSRGVPEADTYSSRGVPGVETHSSRGVPGAENHSSRGVQGAENQSSHGVQGVATLIPAAASEQYPSISPRTIPPSTSDTPLTDAHCINPLNTSLLLLSKISWMYIF